MKKVEYWQWWLRSETEPHEITVTQFLTSESEALERGPKTERVPGTLVVRELPETCQRPA